MGVGLFSTFSRLLAFYRAAEVATYATQMRAFIHILHFVRPSITSFPSHMTFESSCFKGAI